MQNHWNRNDGITSVSALKRLMDYTLGSQMQSDGEDTPFVLAVRWEVVLCVVGKENASVDCVAQTSPGFTRRTSSPVFTCAFKCLNGELRVLKTGRENRLPQNNKKTDRDERQYIKS